MLFTIPDVRVGGLSRNHMRNVPPDPCEETPAQIDSEFGGLDFSASSSILNFLLKCLQTRLCLIDSTLQRDSHKQISACKKSLSWLTSVSAKILSSSLVVAAAPFASISACDCNVAMLRIQQPVCSQSLCLVSVGVHWWSTWYNPAKQASCSN